MLLAQIKRKLNKYAESEKILKNLLFQNPENNLAALELAFVEFELKNYDQFSEYYFNGLPNLRDGQFLMQLMRDIYDLLNTKEIEILKSGELDGNFYLNFWRNKDPNPVTKVNERLVLHYQRLAYAREIYKEDGFTGYDDRGKIYVRYGEPDQRFTSARIEMNISDNESWVYNILGKTITFDFVQNGATYRLVDDLSEAIGSGVRNNQLGILQRLYEERSHLDGSYLKIANELNQVVVTRQSDRQLANISSVIEKEKVKRIQILNDIPQSTFDYELPGSDLPFDFNYAYFYDNNRYRIELYFAINRNIFESQNLKPGKLPAVKQSIVLQNSDYEILVNGSNIIDLNKNKSDQDVFIFQSNIFADQNNLQCSVQLECEKTNQVRLINLPIKLQPYNINGLNVSSIQLAEKIHPALKDDNRMFIKNDIFIFPYPFAAVSKSKPIYFYFEIYNLRIQPENIGEYQIELQIFRDKDSMNFTDLIKALNPFSSPSNQSVSTTFSKNCIASFVSEYFAVDLSALQNGRYRLLFKITDKNTADSINRRINLNITQ